MAFVYIVLSLACSLASMYLLLTIPKPAGFLIFAIPLGLAAFFLYLATNRRIPGVCAPGPETAFATQVNALSADDATPTLQRPQDAMGSEVAALAEERAMGRRRDREAFEVLASIEEPCRLDPFYFDDFDVDALLAAAKRLYCGGPKRLFLLSVDASAKKGVHFKRRVPEGGLLEPASAEVKLRYLRRCLSELGDVAMKEVVLNVVDDGAAVLVRYDFVVVFDASKPFVAQWRSEMVRSLNFVSAERVTSDLREEGASSASASGDIRAQTCPVEPLRPAPVYPQIEGVLSHGAAAMPDAREAARLTQEALSAKSAEEHRRYEEMLSLARLYLAEWIPGRVREAAVQCQRECYFDLYELLGEESVLEAGRAYARATYGGPLARALEEELGKLGYRVLLRGRDSAFRPRDLVASRHQTLVDSAEGLLIRW